MYYNTITIDNLNFSGKHGFYGDEETIEQLFGVKVVVAHDFRRSIRTGNINDTVDYKVIEKLVKNIIEGERHILIETLADDIAQAVLEATSVASVEVTLTKLRARSLGVPSITLRKEREVTTHESILLPFDAHAVAKEIATRGGASFPILSDSFLAQLCAEAEQYVYQQQPEELPSGVREQLSSVETFPYDSLLFTLKEVWEAEWKRQLGPAETKRIFPKGLRFNEMSLQKYLAGSLGITPHKDFKQMGNLICIFVLKGEGKTALCIDREGNNPDYFDTTPGNVIILRAPGFLGNEDGRPFHFVSDITSERIVAGIRQNFQV